MNLREPMRLTGLDARGTAAFAFVGIAATLIYLMLALAGSRLGFAASASSLAAYLIAAGWSYAGHRWLTYRSQAPVARTAPRFVALTVAQYGIALIVPALLADHLGFRAEIAYLAVCGLVPLSSLVLMRFVFDVATVQERRDD